MRRLSTGAVTATLFIVMVAAVVFIRFELPPTTWRSLLNAGIGFLGGCIFMNEFCECHRRPKQRDRDRT